MSVFDLAAKLSVTGASQAAGAMRSVNKETKALKGGFQQVGKIGGHTKTALTGVAAIGTGAAVALGGMAKAAVGFEAKMGGVRSVLTGTAEQQQKEFTILNKLALKLGASTVFSASEAAQGIEIMKRAGFTATDVVKGLGGVMDAAAAEGLSLQRATDVVAGTLRKFGLDAAQSTAVADVLAKTSAKSNTNIDQLGEAMKNVGGVAKVMGISLGETSAILGVLANSGSQGGRAGTELANALSKMFKPSKDGQRIMRKYNLQLTQTGKDGKKVLRPMSDIVAQLVRISKAQPGVLKQGRVFEDLFGKRGARAMAALVTQAKKSPDALKALTKDLNKTALGGTNFAKSMADKRLANFSGQMKLLKSAFEGLSIAIFGNFTKGGASAVQTFGKMIQAVTLFMQGLKEAERTKALKALGLSPSTIKTAKGVAQGIKDAIKDIKQVFIDLKDRVLKPLGIAFKKEGEGGARSFARTLTKVVAGVAILGPALIALAPILMTLKGTIGALGGAFKLAFSPAGKYLLVAGLLVNAFGKGKTFGEKLKNVLGGIAGFLKPIVGFLTKAAQFLGPGGTLAALAGIGIAKRAAGGLLSRLAGRGGMLGGAAGLLSGTVAGGMPVMVTNWPAGLGGLGNALGSGGTGFFAKLKGFLGKAAPIAKAALPVAGALAVGLGIGTMIDRQFKLSDKISSSLVKPQLEAAKMRARVHELQLQSTTAGRQVLMFRNLSKRFGTAGVEGGKQRIVTQAFVMERLKQQFTRLKLSGERQAQLLKQVAPIIATLPKSKADAITKKRAELDSTVQQRATALKRAQAEKKVKGAITPETQKLLDETKKRSDELQKQLAAMQALAGQPIKVETKLNVDGKTLASTVNNANRNSANRQGQRPEGKAAPSAGVKS